MKILDVPIYLLAFTIYLKPLNLEKIFIRGAHYSMDFDGQFSKVWFFSTLIINPKNDQIGESFKYEAILPPHDRKKNFFQLNAQSDYKIAYRLKLPFTAKLLQRTTICIGTLKGNRNSKVLHTLYWHTFLLYFSIIFLIFTSVHCVHCIWRVEMVFIDCHKNVQRASTSLFYSSRWALGECLYATYVILL